MSQPKKNDPAREWMFVEMLLDDEIERIQNLSDKELEGEMRAQGLDPSHVPSAEELMAKVQRPGAERDAAAKANGPTRIATVTALPTRSRRVFRVVTLLAATLGGAVLARRWSQPHTIVSHPYPAAERAAAFREQAFKACGQQMWTLCEQKLDEAKKIEPEGESDPRVQQARGAIASALHNDSSSAPEPSRRP